MPEVEITKRFIYFIKTYNSPQILPALIRKETPWYYRHNQAYHLSHLRLNQHIWSTSVGVCADEQPTTYNQQNTGHPSYIDGGSQLSFSPWHCLRIIEVHDDNICRPADSNKAHYTCNYKDCTSCYSSVSLFTLLFSVKVGAIGSNKEQSNGDHTDSDRGTDQCSSCLEILSQSQDGVICFALHVSGALQDAGHPQAFPEHLCCHDVCSPEGCHFPHRQCTHQDCTT